MEKSKYFDFFIDKNNIMDKKTNMMQRKITANLLAWKNSKNRKPLILNGARQVGKTYTLETFAKENFDNVL